MDAATGLQPIANHPTVRDRHRQGGNSEAFRRALQEKAEGEAEAAADGDDGAAETPVRTRLQRQRANSRREDGQRHIDVLA